MSATSAQLDQRSTDIRSQLEAVTVHDLIMFLFKLGFAGIIASLPFAIVAAVITFLIMYAK